MKIHRYITFLLLFIVGSWLASCATNPVTGKKELMLLSSNQERAMGEQSDRRSRSFLEPTKIRRCSGLSSLKESRWPESPIVLI